MQKKQFSLFLAAGLAAGAVHAQSSATMYGVIDTGIAFGNHTTGNTSAWKLNNGNRAATRWGLKGREDLGGGLATIFQLETGFDVNTGAIVAPQAGRIFGRHAYVGLDSKDYGQLLLGRTWTIPFRYGIPLDPLNYSLYGLVAQDSEFAGHADNMLAYNLKKGPFEFNSLYSFGYEAVTAAAIPGNYRVDKEVDVGARYVDGLINVSAFYTQRQGTTAATGNQDERRFLIGGTYAPTSKTTLYAGYELLLNDVATTVASQPSRSMFYAGARYYITPFIDVAAASYYTSYRAFSGHALSSGLQADYLLSKRTSLYVNGTYVVNSSKSKLSALGAAIPAVAGANQLGLSVGVLHNF
ncbi:porin [Paraburkholderia atlantica]|uniref:porin n=1 Tax=Paraburkholderia atlantica TaxID=2654982 RepID=UPI00187B2326|nr:porin [Paraburkholderia atlantica]